MSEAERLEFLAERDKFLNEECARIAQLPNPTWADTGFVVSGRVLYSISSDGSSTDNNEDAESACSWNDWVLDEPDDSYQLLSPYDFDSEVNIFAQPREGPLEPVSQAPSLQTGELEADS